ATHRRRISAPSVSDTFCGATTLPLDFDILRPSPSTVKPCVKSALYGGTPFSMQETSSDEWNQPRCWSEPSRERAAGKPVSETCEPARVFLSPVGPPITVWWVEP